MLCIAINLEKYPAMVDMVKDYASISLSVGVHPNEDIAQEPKVEELISLGKSRKVIAIGETGLDYFRSKENIELQKNRLKRHIEAAKVLNKPLIIHTRVAGHDVLDILADAGANQVGGIIHCFTEDWEYAKKALDLGFYISFSGIVTFKNAQNLKETVKKVPTDKFLLETDSPYLAPVPYRGKPNYPMYVSYVAEKMASLRGIPVAEIARFSTENFYTLFPAALETVE